MAETRWPRAEWLWTRPHDRDQTAEGKMAETIYMAEGRVKRD